MQSPLDPADQDRRALDRHALVMAVWLPLGFVGLALLVHGLKSLDGWLVGGAFAAVIAAFVAHVIVNAVYGSFFSGRELALGLVAYVAALLTFLLALLFGSEAVGTLFVPLGAGFLVLAVAVLFYLVTHLGLRRTFEAFDVIRDFRPGGAAPPRGR